jgi:hypothetical protein
MSIMNRRNAVLGWATWTVFKRFLKNRGKAEVEAPVVEETKRSLWRRGGEQVVVAVEEPPKRKKRAKRLIPFLAATAVGVGVWLSTRRPKHDEPAPPKADEPVE